MAIKIKTTLIILFTFILGMVAGSFITQAFFKYRMEKVLAMGAPEGFIDHFERIIEPTSKQRESVRKILDKYGQQMFQMRQKSLKAFLALNQAMQKELKSILTPRQQKRLEERLLKRPPGKFDRPGRPGNKHPHPPWGVDEPPPPHWQQRPPDKEGKPQGNEEERAQSDRAVV
jgi:Spy/CpxP family protein refolding chaperone